MEIILTPKNSKKVDALYALLSIDKDGMEGIIGGPFKDLPFIPFVSGDIRIIEILESDAIKICKKTGHTYKISKYVRVED